MCDVTLKHIPSKKTGTTDYAPVVSTVDIQYVCRSCRLYCMRITVCILLSVGLLFTIVYGYCFRLYQTINTARSTQDIVMAVFCLWATIGSMCLSAQCWPSGPTMVHQQAALTLGPCSPGDKAAMKWSEKLINPQSSNKNGEIPRYFNLAYELLSSQPTTFDHINVKYIWGPHVNHMGTPCKPYGDPTLITHIEWQKCTHYINIIFPYLFIIQKP